MEAAFRNSGPGFAVKEEKRIESGCDKEDWKDEMVLKGGNGRKDQKDANEKALGYPKQDHDQLEVAKAQMGEVKEENQRLRMYLDKMMKDYHTLQKQFHEIVQQEAQKPTNTDNIQQQIEEPELVSLSLGRNSSDQKKDGKYKIASKCEVNEKDKEGLALGLDCKFEVSKTGLAAESSMNSSFENSLEEGKEEGGEKMVKTVRSGDDEVLSQQNPTKRARVSVRVRCDTPTMNDGCQWRKYGQKIAKGNPCPRAYYRCTVAPSCPVRKQVQRFAEDMSILITTYEGTHNHPLPISATAMASTTSAAAYMLMSGSSTSGSGSNPSGTPTTTAADLHGLNFYLSDNSKSKPFFLPNSSISSSPSCPTITLDLTNSNPSSSSSHFNITSTNFPPRYSSTNLNFTSLESNNLPISWPNGLLSYGTHQPFNKNQIGSLNFGRQPHENLYQSYMQKNTIVGPDNIEAATKVITSDPSFQSALAAALASIIGSGSGGGGGGTTVGNHGGGDKLGQNLKMSETFAALSNFPSTSNANKCTSSYLNKAPPTRNSQPGSLMFLPPPLPFSTSKSKSTSPDDNRDHII